MNETRRENKEHGHWIEIIVESHWSSLFPWYYSIIFLICVSRSWCTHTPWIKGCSAVGGCRADRYWRFWASVPPRAPLHIPNWLPAMLLPLGRTDTRARSGLGQYLSLCITAKAELPAQKPEKEHRGGKIFQNTAQILTVWSKKMPFKYSILFSTS